MKNVVTFLLFFVSSFVFSQNSFNVTSQSVGVNTSFSVEIGLENTSEVTAFQFDLSHNESAYELLSGSTLTTRAENHFFSVSTIDETTIRVIVYSASNEVISIGSGAILNLNFSSNNEPGIYGLSMSDIVLSDQNGAALSVSSTGGNVTILGPRYDLVTTAVNFGEIPINSTPLQSVNVSNTGNEDLIISSYSIDAPFSLFEALPVTIPSGNSRSFSVSVDTSNKQVVSKELSFTTNDQDPLRALQTTTVTADIFAVNEIYIGFGQGESNTEIEIPVAISNMEAFSGFQFDITLPNDVSYVENSAVFTSRAEDHTIAGSMINSNTLRFVSYSGSNTNFSGNQGDVFNFKIIPNITSGTYALPISNSIISNVLLGDIISDAYNGSFTINAPYLSTSIQTINYGNIPITDVQTTNVTLTNTGSASLLIDQLVYNTDELSFPLEIPTTLEVSQSIDVELTFTPNQVGNFNQDISIRNNSPEEQQIISVLANVFSPNYLTLLDTNVLRGNSYNIPINLVNNDPIRAIQYDINIPDGFIFDIDNVIETSVLDNFTTSISSIGDNTYRFVIYTLSNDIINSGNQTILTLPIFVENSIDLGQYTFEFSNIVLSSETNQNISSDALSLGYVYVIEDSVAPVITLLGDNPITIEVGTTYTDAGATATDNFDGDLTSSIVTVSTVNTAIVGVYSVSYNVSDTSGNAAVEVTRTVTVVDTTVPVITLLGEDPITIEVGTTYTDAGATATDTYDGDITSSIVTVSTVNTAIVGVYSVSYNVSDTSGNAAAEVTRTVTVVDTTVPVITLLGEDSVIIEVGDTYTDAGATATDTYDGDITSSIVTVSTVNTAIVGVYLVTYNVSDTSGNAAVEVTRTVTVVDTTVPVITLLGEDSVTIEVGDTYTDAGATATDTYDGDITLSIVTVSTVNTAIVGVYSVTYNVSDANGNAAAEVTRTVTVVDTTVPVITLLGEDPITIEVGDTYTDAGATATDNFDGDITSSIVTVSTVNTAIVGVYSVTYNVTDTNGNAAAEVTRTVTVVDTTVPVITLLGEDPITIEVGDTYTDAGATATDTYDGDITSSIVTVSTVNTAIVGVYSVSYNVTDTSGNAAAEVTRTVTVVDTTVPVITLLGEDPVTIEVGDTYLDAGATATDNFDGDLTSSIVTVSTVNTAIVGVYSVTYNVSDTNGNAAAEVTRTVTVVDTTVPVITLLGEDSVIIEVGDTYLDAGATATDTYDGDITSSIVTVSTVNTAIVGVYLVTYNVSDANGNAAAEVTRTVTVVDTTVPVITLLGEDSVTIEVGTTYTDAGATATDTYDGDITSSIVTVSTVNTAIVGVYLVTYNVSDTSGNAAAEVTRTVTVVDTTVPVITLLGEDPVTIEVGDTYLDAGATATDIYDGDITSSIVTISTVNTAIVGVYSVSYNVTDANGNAAAEVTRTVTVVDTTVPVITLLGEDPVTIEVGAVYTDAGATALDNYDGDITSSIVEVSTVDTAIAGSYTVTYDVADASGNTALTVTRSVNVIEDTVAPVITLLGDNPITIEVGDTYTDAGATATDNFDGDLTSSIVTVSTVNTSIVGVYSVTYNVSDTSGNAAAEVTRTVTVVDTTVPVITLLGDNPITIEVGDTYTDAGATATDTYDGDITSSIVTVSTVNTAIVGVYSVTYNVSDTSGNVAAEVTRTVNVVDTTVPVITLLGEDPVTIVVGDTYTDAGATATDTYDGDITSSIVTVSTVNTAIVGVYSVTYNVSDANGNAAIEVTRTVNVEDDLSLEDFNQIEFSLFPNPSSGDVTVKYYLPEQMNEVIIKVYDMLGRLVTVTTNERGQGIQQVNLDLNTLDKGNYILIICAGNNSREKFINNKILILK